MAFISLNEIRARHASEVRKGRTPPNKGKKFPGRVTRRGFKKGHIPWNVRNPEAFREKISGEAGRRMKKTQFKPGHTPKNTRPVGHITYRRHKNRAGYKYIKIAEPSHWVMLHHFTWEINNGPVPEDHILVFKNGDQADCRIENLELITRQDLIARNRQNYDTDARIASHLARTRGRGRLDPDLKQAILENPDLIELKRQQITLRRLIDGKLGDRAQTARETV